MTEDPNAEILTVSELTIQAVEKELGITLDYSVDSFKDLEALIQHVKSHFLKLKGEGKLTEQTVQRASISIGGYLGEVVRRHQGGTWIAKNSIVKVLVINDQEFSPILYIFQRLTKDSAYSLESYWADINKKLTPQEKIENRPPVSETPKKTTNRLMGNRGLIMGGVISLVVLSIIGIVGITRYSNATRIPPTVTPRPTATRIPASPTPSIIMKGPINYLRNLPSGFAINDSMEQTDRTLEDGTRSISFGLINREARQQGDVVSIVYLITFYPSEAKAISEYRRYLNNLETKGEGVVDHEISIEGTDASAMYISPQENNVMAGEYISRVKNVMVDTAGLTVYDPETITELFLRVFMARVAKIHILAIDHT